MTLEEAVPLIFSSYQFQKGCPFKQVLFSSLSLPCSNEICTVYKNKCTLSIYDIKSCQLILYLNSGFYLYPLPMPSLPSHSVQLIIIIIIIKKKRFSQRMNCSVYLLDIIQYIHCIGFRERKQSYNVHYCLFTLFDSVNKCVGYQESIQ